MKSGVQPGTTLIFPFSDESAHPVILGEPVSAISNLTKITREFTPSTSSTGGKLISTTTQPVIYEYMPDGFDYGDSDIVQNAFFSLLASDGLYGQGVVQGREIIIEGTNESQNWYIDPSITSNSPAIDTANLLAITTLDIGEFGAQAWGQCTEFGVGGLCEWFCLNLNVPCGDNPNLEPPTTHCSDGVDNDSDGGKDLTEEECVGKPAQCTFPNPELLNSCWGTQKVSGYKAQWESGKSFALFGEGQFCSSYPHNWTERLFSIAREGRNLFNEARPPLGFPGGGFPIGGEMELRFMAAGCWIFPGNTIEDRLNAAIACNQDGICGSFQDVQLYPYKNKGKFASGYYSSVWSDVQHGATYSSSDGLRDVLHIAQTIYYHGVENLGLACGGGEGDKEGPCCGARGSNNLGGDNLLGASVAQYFPVNSDLAKTCIGGERDNRACEENKDCPDGACPVKSQVCNGGINDTLVCNGPEDCPGGVCVDADSPLSDNCVTYQTIAHEIGHTMGLQHDGSSIEVCNIPGNPDFCVDMNSFMQSPAGGGPVLNAANQEVQINCLSTWDCPRPGGFQWDGDTCDTSCP